jgi:flagellar hook-associated protein 2
MSSTPISGTGLTSNSTLTSAGSGAPLQITGLASGLNTNAIIQAELQQKEIPMTNMQAEVAGLTSVNNQLSAFQSSLTTVSLDAQALGDPTLFAPTQAVTSSEPNLVTATSTSGVGAIIGGTNIAVTQLASAAQRTFAFTSPTAADTITIDGQTVNVTADETSQQLANDINGDSQMDVWASATSSGQLVLSSRTTGNNGPNFIQVSDPGTTLVENAALAQNGQNALYSINNGATQSSPSDTVTNAMPGVTLTFNGVTSPTQPVTVTVQPPSPNTQSILTAVNQFVSDYNNAISSIESTVNTQPSKSTAANPNSGSLFGDNELESLLANMRTAMVTAGAGLPAGLAALSDIGITTGGASPGGARSSSISGELTVNTQRLTAAIQSNPSGVQALLASFSQSFQSIVNDAAGPGGAIDTRIQGDSAEITNLSTQVSAMRTLFATQQQQMEQRWALVEGTISKLNSQGSALAAQLGSLSSSSSKSSGL